MKVSWIVLFSCSKGREYKNPRGKETLKYEVQRSPQAQVCPNWLDLAISLCFRLAMMIGEDDAKLLAPPLIV
jgi:hypothetical protein